MAQRKIKEGLSIDGNLSFESGDAKFNNGQGMFFTHQDIDTDPGTISAHTYLVYANVSGGRVNLPTFNLGLMYIIITAKLTSDATLYPDGSDTINGTTSLPLQSERSYIVHAKTDYGTSGDWVCRTINI